MVTIELPDDVARRLDAAARRRGLPAPAFVAELLEAAEAPDGSQARLQDFCGVEDLDATGLSSHVDAHLDASGYGT